jgi:hypothetical protein
VKLLALVHSKAFFYFLFLKRVEREGGTYGVASGVFLLSANHETGSLGCVEGAAALDDGFALDTAGSVFGADASNVVPVLVGHFYDLCCLTDRKDR